MKRLNILALIVAFLWVSSSFALDLKKFEGHWVGSGKVIVSWCKQKKLNFDIKIDSKGKVSGKIGDAKIKEGKIYSNFLGILNRDYVIEVELEGFVVKKEKIKRKKMRLMVDTKGDYLIGAFRSSGLKIGDKNSMAMTGVDLILENNR